MTMTRIVNDNLREACIAYARKRGQMGARKAAAHVMQEYGVTSSELSAALADRRLLLSQGADIDTVLDDA